MPSLRKKVSSYFRQLSFHNEPRERRMNINENSFVTKYLQGHITVKEGPQILYGKIPTDLPNYEIAQYNAGAENVVGCYTGPNGGLTTVKRKEKHLSVLDADIDFIDTAQEEQVAVVKKSPQQNAGLPLDNMTMLIKVAGQEYRVTNRKKHDSRSQSLDSLSNFDTKVDKTKISTELIENKPDTNPDHSDLKHTHSDSTHGNNKSVVKTKPAGNNSKHVEKLERKQSHGLAKSKSEGNPFQHKKKGKIIRITQRPTARATEVADCGEAEVQKDNDGVLPKEWNLKSECVFGLSDSLYDRNLVTKNKNGDPIADCFGIIARGDSAVLALADGVNWGEKACIAAKSAVHGCLHYLSKTIFSDTKPFDNLTIKDEPDVAEVAPPNGNNNKINNTREVFVCLLRAFNCAHDLILENKGMLTTLTVAVILPLKQKNIRNTNNAEGCDEKANATRFVCCVCNVGDTLAYVYSQKYGMRELTKGSHDIHCNRDMRDALGALGPVDGIKPELSNLTLSITTLQKGDIVFVASDGLTDNFDPNVCKFTVNANLTDPLRVKHPAQAPHEHKSKPPVKPPRKRNENTSRSSTERSTRSNSLNSNKSANHEAVANKSNDGDGSKHLPDYNNPLVAEFMRENSVEKSTRRAPKPVENRASSLRKQSSSHVRQTSSHRPKTSSFHDKQPNLSDTQSQTNRYNIFRSKTSIDFRATSKQILRNDDGIPYVTPIQRYELTLLLMEDILKKGISGSESQCTTARKLCENLVSFTFSITSAKRHTLEDQDLYFDNRNNILVEVSSHEKKIRRKRGLERVQNLPGKLDHVSIVAYNVGNFVV